jgi:DNA invertase Pin-like site-specific DNA recombinase
MANNNDEKYYGMRAWLMTRVSTLKQEEGYGHPSQEQEIREKLVEPPGLDVTRTLRDTYTGLDFEERKVLDEILQGAKHKEFDILILDVLDRLGRKGLERELWRMRLRATGARILTTDPNDHADDDSFTGELIRMINGHGSEKELQDIMRRTMNGKRAKAEGRDKDGNIGEKKVVGLGPRPPTPTNGVSH